MSWVAVGVGVGTAAGTMGASALSGGGEGGQPMRIEPGLASVEEQRLIRMLMAAYTDFTEPVEDTSGIPIGEKKLIHYQADPGAGWVRTSRTGIPGPNWEFEYIGTGTKSKLSEAVRGYLNFLEKEYPQKLSEIAAKYEAELKPVEERLTEIGKMQGPTVSFGGKPMGEWKPKATMGRLADIETRKAANIMSRLGPEAQIPDLLRSAGAERVSLLTGVPLDMWKQMQSARYGTPVATPPYQPTAFERMLPSIVSGLGYIGGQYVGRGNQDPNTAMARAAYQP